MTDAFRIKLAEKAVERVYRGPHGPAREMCKVLCRECPFKRSSAPGYLGICSGDPWEFLTSAGHGEIPLPCHMRVNWSSARAQEQAQTAHVCRGYLTMLRNECKRPRNPELAVLVEQVVPDRDAVFANRNEFMLHHNDPELATSFRNAFAERM